MHHESEALDKERLETSPPRADRNCMVRLSKLIVSVSLTAVTLALPGLANASEPNASEQGAYIVTEGDTLGGISAAMGVPLGDLLQANGLIVTSVILPGQRLEVPDVSARGSSAVAAGPLHTVAAGDTLGGIAARHDVSLESLLAANQMSVNSLITPGMSLVLPAGAAPPADSPGGRIALVLEYALAQVGKPYEFFTAGSATFDCSGLTMAAYGRVGIPLVHHSPTQAGQGAAVDYWNGPIRSGDLVFLDTDWDGVIDHVGIALDATTWVHASESRDVVLTAPIPAKSVIVGVRRFVAE